MDPVLDQHGLEVSQSEAVRYSQPQVQVLCANKTTPVPTCPRKHISADEHSRMPERAHRIEEACFDLAVLGRVRVDTQRFPSCIDPLDRTAKDPDFSVKLHIVDLAR